MDLSCPKCSKQLPEVETLKYRFCPHCGAEIAAEPKKLAEASPDHRAGFSTPASQTQTTGYTSAIQFLSNAFGTHQTAAAGYS